MRSAHLFIVSGILATGLMSGCGTIGGNGGGVVGFDTTQGNLQFLQPTAVTVSPKNSTRSVTQTVQLSVQAQLPNTGQIVEATRFATFLSANPAIATVDGSGLVTAVAPGTTTVNATINGVTDVANITVPPLVPRLFVSSSAGNTITVYDPAVGGAQVPSRTFAGNNTLLNNPRQLAVNGQELFVVNSASNTVSVFSLHGNGNIAPLRTIVGTNTTLNSPQGLAIVGNELFVSNSATNSITVYNVTGTGNIAPLRTLGALGAVNTTIESPRHLAAGAGELHVASTFGALGRLQTFSSTAVGDPVPLRSVVATVPVIGLHQAATDLAASVSGAAEADVVRLLAATLATLNVIDGRPTAVNTGINTPTGVFLQGGELFVADSTGNRVAVFPSNQNTDTAPTRVITGNLTTPDGVVIGQSI